MKKVALYVRSAIHSVYHIKSQIESLRKFAQKRGLEVVGVYSDNGKCGTDTDRDGLAQMLTAAKSQKFDAIICANTSRLTRNLSSYVEIEKQLADAGVKILVM